jgi:hypothetical protein
MKRKLLALLISLQIILSAFVPIFTTVAATEGDATGGASQGTTPDTPTSSVTSIFPDSKLTWMSYRDYLLQQATNAWNTPEMYIGYEIQFSTRWQTIFLKSSNSNTTESTASVNFGDTQSFAGNTIVANQTKLIIDDYYYNEQTTEIWYKVKAADGYELPSIL